MSQPPRAVAKSKPAFNAKMKTKKPEINQKPLNDIRMVGTILPMFIFVAQSFTIFVTTMNIVCSYLRIC